MYTWDQLVGRASSFLNRLYCFGAVGLHTLGLKLAGASLFLNRFYWISVVGFCTLGFCWESTCTGYVHISLYVLMVWCSRELYTWG